MARQGPKSSRGGQSWRKQLASMAREGRIPNAIVGNREQQAEALKAISKLYDMPNVEADIQDVGDAVYIRYMDGTSVTGRMDYPSGENATQEEKDGALKWALLNHQKRYGATAVRNQRADSEIDKLRARVAKLPTSGAKVQDAYIDTLKYYHGIDLTSARDTYFDNRRMFNIDTSKLNPSVRNQIRRYLTDVPMFDVQVSENGANRLAIIVKKKK